LQFTLYENPLRKEKVEIELPSEHKYRVLGEYDKKNVVIGMEDKDMRDLAGAVLDHELGESPQFLDLEKLGARARQDWGLWKTCTMSLQNMYRNLQAVMERYGVSECQIRTIAGRLEAVLDALSTRYAARKPSLSFGNRQWWEDVEEQVR